MFIVFNVLYKPRYMFRYRKFLNINTFFFNMVSKILFTIDISNPSVYLFFKQPTAFIVDS